jgi:hypothetical protein
MFLGPAAHAHDLAIPVLVPRFAYAFEREVLVTRIAVGREAVSWINSHF